MSRAETDDCDIAMVSAGENVMWVEVSGKLQPSAGAASCALRAFEIVCNQLIPEWTTEQRNEWLVNAIDVTSGELFVGTNFGFVQVTFEKDIVLGEEFHTVTFRHRDRR